MGVVIQEMVTPVISGVGFSRNPVTGERETLVEALEGSGEALLQQGMTPARWVRRGDTWVERPEAPILPAEVIEDVVNGVIALGRQYGKPVDVEWTYDGQHITWLQLREITSLSHLDVYSNRMSREYMPGLIPPLVWSINVNLVNSAWIALLTEVMGPNDLAPHQLSKAFCYRSYFNMGRLGSVFETLGLPRTMLEDIDAGSRRRFRPSLKTLTFVPRMAWFILDKLRYHRKLERLLPDLERRYLGYGPDDAGLLDAAGLLQRISALEALSRETAYHNIVTPILTKIRLGALQRKLEGVGLDPNTALPGIEIDGSKDLDPSTHLAALHRQFLMLPVDARRALIAGGDETLRDLAAISGPVAEFGVAFDGFLARFGHLSDNTNDFSVVHWRETPSVLLKVIADFAQPAATSSRADATAWAQVSPRQRRRLRRRAQRVAELSLLRDRTGALYTFGYGLFRPYFLALGAWMVEQGMIEASSDIFFLYWDEVKDAVQGRATQAGDLMDWVSERRDEMDSCQDVTLPETIYGDAIPPPRAPGEHDRVLQGVPTSRGVYEGRVCVVTGLGDFDKVREGDVLVVPYSDVGWTPLFRKAGAVVSQSGGILAHAAIVAREYGIPAVVGVSEALRLPDEARIVVDGYRGTVTLIDPP
jgi:pyruvate,water dikinase